MSDKQLRLIASGILKAHGKGVIKANIKRGLNTIIQAIDTGGGIDAGKMKEGIHVLTQALCSLELLEHLEEKAEVISEYEPIATV